MSSSVQPKNLLQAAKKLPTASCTGGSDSENGCSGMQSSMLLVSQMCSRDQAGWHSGPHCFSSNFSVRQARAWRLIHSCISLHMPGKYSCDMCMGLGGAPSGHSTRFGGVGAATRGVGHGSGSWRLASTSVLSGSARLRETYLSSSCLACS